ncbi:MAG: hypothetical protein IPG74_02110 [Flavobacteriales bacterium]|nr:hypothetical protein [Flavobacteriales bacterium]MBK9194839.1 hypothetical protein [Flavobacteriales bacterium]
MNSSALTLMVFAMGTVTLLTGYFFYRVLTAKPKPEPDSYTDDDED